MEIRSTSVLILCGMICCTISSTLKPDSDLSIEDTVIYLKQKLKQMEDRLSTLEKMDTSDLIQKAKDDISVAVQEAEKKFLDENNQLLSKMKEMETESTDARDDVSLKLNGMERRMLEQKDEILKRVTEVETRCVVSTAVVFGRLKNAETTFIKVDAHLLEEVQQAKNMSSGAFEKVHGVEQEVARVLERERSKTEILQNIRDSLMLIEKNYANISHVSQLDENVQNLDEKVKAKFQSFQSELSPRVRQLEESCAQCGDVEEMNKTLRNHSLEITTLNAKLLVIPYCPDPPRVTDGYPLIRNSGRSHGDVLTYACRGHRTLVGSGKIVCAFGQWTGVAPECMNNCNAEDLESYDGVVIPKVTTIEHLKILDLRCRRGYAMNFPPKSITCFNGTWRINGDPCVEGGCPLNFSENPEASQQLTISARREKLETIFCENYDYVWKGRLNGRIRSEEGFLNISFMIEDVIKAGIEKADDIEGETRTLLSRDDCPSAYLYRGVTYLILGRDGQAYTNADEETWYWYPLDRTSVVHLWTSTRSSPDPILQRDLNYVTRSLKDRGCEL